MSPGQQLRPADLGKAGCSWPRPRPPRLITPHRKAAQPEPLNHTRHQGSLPPAARHDPLPGSRVKGACGAAARALRAPLTRPPARRTRQLSGTGSRLSHPQTRATMTAQTPYRTLAVTADAGKADIACRRLAELSRSVMRRHRWVWQARCPTGQTSQLSPGLCDAQQRYHANASGRAGVPLVTPYPRLAGQQDTGSTAATASGRRRAVSHCLRPPSQRPPDPGLRRRAHRDRQQPRRSCAARATPPAGYTRSSALSAPSRPSADRAAQRGGPHPGALPDHVVKLRTKSRSLRMVTAIGTRVARVVARRGR